MWLAFVGLLACSPIEAAEPSAMLFTQFDIPDPSQPTEDNAIGPSGQLVAFSPSPASAQDVIGKEVTRVSDHVGTYGMGGPGFFGLQLGDQWLVVAMWGAGDWMTSDGRLVTDFFYDSRDRTRPWIHGEFDELSPLIVGQTITSFDVRPHSMEIVFSNGVELTIEENASVRPHYEGNGLPRQFKPEQDLRNSVFLSPTDELWYRSEGVSGF